MFPALAYQSIAPLVPRRLNEAGYKVGNMRVDMNPIRPDKTGTLEDFLERSERYLDEKTEQMKARG